MFNKLFARVSLLATLLAAAALTPGSKTVQAQGAATFRGTLSMVWGDPRFPGGAGSITYTLETPDGRYLPVQVTRPATEMLRFNRQAVVITGRSAMIRRAAAAPAESSIAADAIDVDRQAPAAAAAPAAVVSGTKKVLFLLTQFADDAAQSRPVPHQPSFYLNMTNPTGTSPDPTIPTTVNAFFLKVSNNTFSWSADVGGMGGVGAPGGWIVLPQNKSYYANCSWSSSCFSTSRYNTDAVAAAKAQGINFANYDTINFVISNDLDCCAWGGSTSIDGISHGATWEPPWGQITSTYSHELGHSLGLPHSGWVYYSYDSPWDTMSAIQSAKYITCGSYFSRNDGITENVACDEPGDGYIAGHRDYLGWIPAANQVSVNSTTSGTTVTLEGNSVPLGSAVKLIKVCIPGYSCTGTGSTTRYFTIESRVKNGGTTTQYDNAIPNEGVVIHDFWFGRSAISGGCFFNNQSGWAVPVDSTPGDYNSSTCSQPSGGGLYNAQFGVGSTYTNSTYGFSVNVLSRSGNSFVVSVQSALATQISMDAPGNGASTARPFNVSGWAINRNATSGTGVDAVHVYATPSGGSPVFLGVATYGSARSDIGALYGSQFTNSGWSLTGAGASLAAGNYAVTAYAHNAMTGSFDMTATANVTVTTPVSNPHIAVDSPTAGQVVTSAFEVGGWALDAGSPTGTGVDGVQFYIQPQGAAAPGVFVGTGSYGWTRTDLAAIYGSRFTNCGYHFTITGLSPGSFTLNVYAHSTVTGNYSIVQSVPITVSATALMSIDAPSPEATLTGNSFLVGGWSIDRSVEGTAQSGSGVSTLHVYAYPNPGSNQPPIFLGVATIGVSRADVGAAYGSRYNTSGYQLIVDRSALGLAPGVYNIVVHSRSSVSGTFNNDAVVRVTLQ